VTIVGAGGVGKTRAAVTLAGDLLNIYPDGVWLVDLAPLADQTLVANTVMSTLQLPSITGSALDAIVAYLKARRVLILLDNCEHVVIQAREVATVIMQSCSHVRILSTSREALRVPGEKAYRLPSLAVPPDSPQSDREALQYDSVSLFVDRALIIDASFVVTDKNAHDVTEICRRLDGIPFAIELAAARVNVLAPRQIVERLDQRFRLLTGGNPRALPRQQTMRALIDWSYDLLTPREQWFFESLSMFAGGCKLDEATAVCAVEGEDDIDIVDLLASLVTKSLLVAELAGNEPRYLLVESSRQYARDKLIARRGQEMLARRHSIVYLELAERLENACDTVPDREWLPQAQVELENWRAVLEWAFGGRGDVVLGQRLAALRNVLGLSLGIAEWRRWVRTALDLVDNRTPLGVVARLEHADADGAAHFGERGLSLAAAERALKHYRELGDTRGSAQALALIGSSLAILGRPTEAEPLLREALETARELGDSRLAASLLRNIGNARTVVGDFDAARAHLGEALDLAKALGAEFLAASIVTQLSSTALDAGDLETSHNLNLELLATYRALGPSSLPNVAGVLANIAVDMITVGRYSEAREYAFQALELADSLGMMVFVALSLLYIVVASVLTTKTEGKRTSADIAGVVRLLGFVDSCLTTLAVPNAYCLPKEHARVLDLFRDALGVDELTRLMAAGTTMSKDHSITQARALE
jgi:non-specific serine/threonine protein kinase